MPLARHAHGREAAPPGPDRGRWFLALTGLATAAIGAVFVFLLASAWLRAKEMREWTEVPCTILASRIEQRRHDPHSLPEYRHSVVFAFEWNGALRTGSMLSRRGNPWYANRSKAEKSLKRFPQGAQTTCRVDPRAPDAAVLKPDSLAPGYTIWFPSLFVVGGLGITLRSIRSRNQRPATATGSGKRTSKRNPAIRERATTGSSED